MQISDELINEAEQLLICGNHFDEERIKFIKSLDSCDLLAVPGSGKTTALQAKLYCISKLLKNSSNKGILVLSHTNVAVEEIRKKLYVSCPNLFEYPNFIGTIQDFVDRFLTIPFYNQTYRHAVTRIDSTIYRNEFRKEILRKRIPKDKVWSWYVFNNIEQAVNFGIKITTDGKEISWNYSTCKEFKVAATKVPRTWIGKEEKNREHIKCILRELKEALWEKGILSYDDCYAIAQLYINQHPQIKEIIRNRFKYVFIDETQDLQGHQLEMTDQLFANESICYQRVGDINQSIFHTGVDSTICLWAPRNSCTFNNSLRLSPINASVVDAFMQYREPGQIVQGLRNVPEIEPHILVFDYNHRNLLRTKFKELIELYCLDDFPESKYGYHIIGWNSKWSDGKEHIPSELRLSDLFPDCISKDISTTIYPENLAEYVSITKELKDNKQRIHYINIVVCECLRLCEKFEQKIIKGHICERPYTPTSFQEYIHDEYNKLEHEYRLKKLDIIKKIVQSSHLDVYKSIKDLINWLIESMDIAKTKEYETFISKEYIHKDEDLQINSSDFHVETIHRAKGQTHCATLYIETMYQGKYESMHVYNREKKKATKTKPAIFYSNPFFKEKDIPQKNSYAQNAIKMAYVGLSRPTHLLCYAMHKSSFLIYGADQLQKYGWKIIDLTNL